MKASLFDRARQFIVRLVSSRAKRFLAEPPSPRERDAALQKFEDSLEKWAHIIPARLTRHLAESAPKPPSPPRQGPAAEGAAFLKTVNDYWKPLRDQLADLDAEAQDIVLATVKSVEDQLDARLLPPTIPADDPADPEWRRQSEAARALDILSADITKLVKAGKVQAQERMVGGRRAVYVSLRDVRNARKGIKRREGRRRAPMLPRRAGGSVANPLKPRT